MNLDRLFNPPSDGGSVFAYDCRSVGRSEDAGLTPRGKLKPLCVSVVRAAVHSSALVVSRYVGQSYNIGCIIVIMEYFLLQWYFMNLN